VNSLGCNCFPWSLSNRCERWLRTPQGGVPCLRDRPFDPRSSLYTVLNLPPVGTKVRRCRRMNARFHRCGTFVAALCRDVVAGRGIGRRTGQRSRYQAVEGNPRTRSSQSLVKDQPQRECMAPPISFARAQEPMKKGGAALFRRTAPSHDSFPNSKEIMT
jgi:hypothetical protein